MTLNLQTEDANPPTMASTSKSSTSPEAQPQTQLQPRRPWTTADPHPRLGLSAQTRILLGTTSAGIVGATLGAVQGGHTAQLRFRAEHAHKMPDSTTGWYLYHKSKNYHAMFGGIREGARMAGRTALWTGMALGLESTVDRCRGSKDMFSTVVASLTVAGVFSLRHRFSLSTAARTARHGLLFGFAYGGIQDILGLARGRPIGYVEFIKRQLGGAAASGNQNDQDGALKSP